MWSVATAHGGFHLVGGSAIARLQASLLRIGRCVHEIPKAEKRRLSVRHGRGYAASGAVERGGSGNGYESFTVMGRVIGRAASGELNVYRGKNRWPRGARALPTRVLRAQARLRGLAASILEEIFRARHPTTIGAVRKIFEAPTISLRFLRYPAGRAPGPAFVPHTDFGGITILAHDEVRGLVLESRAGDAHYVEPMPGSLFVNFGDALAMLTNGRLFSPPHEVERPKRMRDAVVFFFDPGFSSLLQPLVEFCGRGERQAPMRFSSYLLLHTFLRGSATQTDGSRARRRRWR